MNEDLDVYRDIAQEEDVKNLYRFFEKFEEERNRFKEQKERFLSEKRVLESEILEISKKIEQRREELRRLEDAKELIDAPDTEDPLDMPMHLQEVEVYIQGNKVSARPTKKLYSYRSVKQLLENSKIACNENNEQHNDHPAMKAKILELELENAKLIVENRDLKQENARLSRYEDIDFGS